MPHWDAVARQAHEDAKHNLPLDGQHLADMAHRVAIQRTTDPRELSLLESTYVREFLAELRNRATEAGTLAILPDPDRGNNR